DGENLDKMKEKGDAYIFVGLSPTIQRQANVPRADRTVSTSNELDLLFSLMFDELLNGSSKVVSKSSAVCLADAPNQCQQHTTLLNNHTTPAPTCQVQTQVPTVASTENMNQAEMVEEYAQVENDEFINIFCTLLQDKGIVISELKKLIEKLKGKSVDTKFEKSSVIRQPNAFKSPRPLVLGKPTTFSNSFIRKDFSKSTSVTQTHVSNDFSKPVTAQTLPTKKKSCLKNTNVLAPGMYNLHTDHTRTRTSKLPQDSKKTNKRVSFSTGVILTTSVSRPQLKSNPQGDRVLRSNSREKKLEIENIVGMLSCLRIKRL
nr:hypothetical protein [Tanacetum cinerariifolium]